MLSTTLTFQQNVNLAKLNLPFIKKVNERHFQIFLDSAEKVIADIKLDDNIFTFSYSSELLLEEYVIIHDIIARLQKDNSVNIDDQKSFLGYLSNGEPAFIVTNWDNWMEYIQDSMKNCL
ncbi:hypothetical protein ACWM35_15960 [Neobacillus sp. K501]